MLIARQRATGFSLIELVITITIFSILMGAFIPSVSTWLSNSKARNSAESFQNAIRLAQAEAIRRGRITLLARTNVDPDVTATPATDGANWYIRIQPLSNSAETATLFQGTSIAKGLGVSIAGSESLLCFNSQGRLTSISSGSTGLSTACSAPTDANTPITFTFSRSGADRSYEVLVYLGGKVRMCDANKSLSDAPDGCP